MEYVLKTKDLTKYFYGKKAVDQVSMEIKKGDIYGFIGKNGAGKTTLMRMVAGLASPTNGSIELFESKDLNKQRKRTGCMIEYPGAYPNMTAYENIEVYRKMLGNPEQELNSKLLEITGLEETAKKKVRHFSLGMKQRLGIAIALLGNPDFLILDEPINGLDPGGIKEVRDLLLKLNKEQEITILVSSHILGELSKIATCYGIIKNGKLIDEFSREELEVRCRRCLKIVVDQPKKAVQLLETQLNITNYDVLEGNTIRIFERLEEAGRINAAIVKGDITLFSSSISGQDLEGYFMELMGGREDD